MAVKIRLKRMGKTHAPVYRVVVVDSRKKRDGRVIEEIGKYNPLMEPSLIEIDSERAQYWLSVGAQPSDAVRRQLHITGDWAKFRGKGNTEGALEVKEISDDEKTKARDEAIAKIQDEAEKQRAKKAEARVAAQAEAEAAAEESAEAEAPAEDA
ncbi:30S ribosomal protein S16 [Flaviflexus salsibiostraticola]|uniref:Small ribosomal subunit protein bS16 n=1 Tax=Flaviflexus salsibiostraticola TaxID=1282737 RepID=A0A3Q8WTP0_9ACTO|nr:30S ribosomal protein S16 [Flaviflexus salsibiostraticola]AZN29721.1 30S ribosomal protein S16 [Flaviflexus salsibiostraticola]